MNIGGNGVDLLGLYALALLLNLAGALWAAGVAMRLRTQQAAPVMQMPVFLLLFFAPVYVPLGLLAGLDPWRRFRESDHAAARGRPGLHLRQPELTLAAFAIARRAGRSGLPPGPSVASEVRKPRAESATKGSNGLRVGRDGRAGSITASMRHRLVGALVERIMSR